MKYLVGFISLILLFSFGSLRAETGPQQQEHLLNTVWSKLHADKPIQGIPVGLSLHISQKPVVNAWTNPQTGEIYVTETLLMELGPSEGELAFVVGHEIGHVLGYWTGLSDKVETQQLQRDLGSFLSRFNFGLESPKTRQNRYQQLQEKFADAIGLYVIKAAGYNPYDSAAFWGRMEMYSGTTNPSLRRWQPYLQDHPFNEDRIDFLKNVLARLQDEEKTKQMAVQPIFQGRVSVPAGKVMGWTVQVDLSEMKGPEIHGEIAARGGLTGNVTLSVYYGERLIYNCPRKTSCAISQPLQQSGTYSVVIDNRGSLLYPREVEGALMLRYAK